MRVPAAARVEVTLRMPAVAAEDLAAEALAAVAPQMRALAVGTPAAVVPQMRAPGAAPAQVPNS